MGNREIANCLTEHAHQLEIQGASLFRIRAYRRAAETILGLSRPASSIYESYGRDGLKNLPGVGDHLSYTIEGLITTGEFRAQNLEEIAECARCVGCP
jgi:DNA polymerase/3'-5' exonuclease PolX